MLKYLTFQQRFNFIRTIIFLKCNNFYTIRVSGNSVCYIICSNRTHKIYLLSPTKNINYVKIRYRRPEPGELTNEV